MFRKSGAPLIGAVVMEGRGCREVGKPCLCLTPERSLWTRGPQDLEEHQRPRRYKLNALARQTRALMSRPGFSSRRIPGGAGTPCIHNILPTPSSFPKYLLLPAASQAHVAPCLEPLTLSLHLMTSSLKSSSTFPVKLSQVLQETVLTLGSSCILHYGRC